MQWVNLSHESLQFWLLYISDPSSCHVLGKQGQMAKEDPCTNVGNWKLFLAPEFGLDVCSYCENFVSESTSRS